MRDPAAHHPGVRGNRNHLRQADPGKDAVISFQAACIESVKILLACVERISILHCEFPHPDQPGTRAGFIPEFGLDLVDHERVLRIALGFIPHKLHGSFLMGHAKDKFIAVAVPKPGQFRPDLGVPARCLPKRSRHHDRQLYFLPAQGVHLFPQNLFDLAGHAYKRRIG